MPELPEVEVVRLFLEDKLTNQSIIDVEVLTNKSFVGNKTQVIDQTIVRLTRIGKQLSIYLSNGLILLVHLKMTGQLIYLDKFEHDKTILGHPTPSLNNTLLPNKSTRLVFTFNSGDKLFFNDQRKFGWIKVFNSSDLEEFQKNLGKDIFDPMFKADYLFRQLQRTSRPIKLALLDQNLVAGVGNIYANDALFLSKIHPQTPSNNISKKQTVLLSNALISIMQQSVLAGGSTAKDNKYVRPDGTFGQNQFNFRVYQREGDPCLVCSTPIHRLKLGGRSTFYCPSCQKRLK